MNSNNERKFNFQALDKLRARDRSFTFSAANTANHAFDEERAALFECLTCKRVWSIFRAFIYLFKK